MDAVEAARLLLAMFSVTGNLEALKLAMVAEAYVLEGLALMGQATVLYAPPGTGKTLVVLWLLVQAILSQKVDPSKVIYVNCDDSLAGLIEKAELAKALGFAMLADGYEGFEARRLRALLLETMARGQARGCVLVLDTLKKFIDLMDKRGSAEFMRLIRRFVLQGGTVIMLAHANKRPGPDGKPIYAGVADILDDADCGYIMWVSSAVGAREKVVEFERKKGRGNVVQRASFGYSGVDGLSYGQLLASVRPIDGKEADEFRAASELRADEPLIEATKVAIRAGIVKRMALYTTVGRTTGCGRRRAEALLDKYTGTDPGTHHWTYTVEAHGAKVYSLLQSDATVAAEVAHV